MPAMSLWKEEILVNTALLTRVKAVRAECDNLSATSKLPQYLKVEDIHDGEHLIGFYTVYSSFRILMGFFEFLGPVVHELNHWGRKQSQQ